MADLAFDEIVLPEQQEKKPKWATPEFDEIVLPSQDREQQPGYDPSKGERWNQEQAALAKDAEAAGLPPAKTGWDRLVNAIDRAHSSGYKFAHFAGTDYDPTGDRSVSIDMGNLSKTLRQKESDERSAGKIDQANATARERAYWEAQAAQGMSADQWKSQTGFDDPPLPPNGPGGVTLEQWKQWQKQVGLDESPDVPTAPTPSQPAPYSAADNRPLFDDGGADLKSLAIALDKARGIGTEAVSAFSPELASRIFGQTTQSMRPEEIAPPIISPEASRQIVGQLPSWAGGNTPFGQGVSESAANALSSFSAPGALAQLPAFALPGVSETYALNVLSELPDQGRKLLETARQYGWGSRETGRLAAEYGITDLTGFLAGKHSTLTRGITGELNDRAGAAPQTPDALRRSVEPSVRESGVAEPLAQAKPPDRADKTAPAGELERVLTENEPNAPETTTPIIRPGETQGDLLANQPEDLTLVGERGTDYSARDEAARVAAAQAKENEVAQARQQPQLFEQSPEQEARRQHEAEIIKQAEESQAGHGDELLDAIEKSGGLPTPGSDIAADYKGELRTALEMSKGGKQVGVKGVFQGKLFRSDAPHPDELTTRLRDRGFNFQTPNDLFNALDQRLRTGKHVFGVPEMAHLMYSGVPMPDALKVNPETEADVKGAFGSFFGSSKFTPFREVLNRWVGGRQKATLEGDAIKMAVNKEVSSPLRQAGISIYREAGGDTDLIRRQLGAAKTPWFRQAALEALKLTPNDIKTADRLDAWYDRKGVRAQATGLIEHLRRNYVNHIWEDTPESRRAILDKNAGKLNTAFRPSKERIVPTLFEGDQAGMKPKSIVASELAAVYAHSMDRALGDRGFVKNLVNTTAADGRPIGVSQQNAAEIALQTKAEGKPNPYRDYQPVRHWAFKGEDYRGDILVHPDYANHVEAAIRPSTIDRPEYASTAAGRLARRAFQKVLSGQGFVKQNMLSIPAFHYVQEGTEAIGHRINPFAAKPIDPRNPVHMDAMNHGLMVASTHGGEAQWIEGLNNNRALLTKIPGIGPKLKASSDYLFQKYIPSLKMETYKAALNRNLDRFKSDLASGKMSVDDVKYHTAKQVNDAYGHLNYADLGRSENIQKITRAILLAPDFLEARVRQALQGAAGLVPGVLARAHGEQRMAFWTLAIGQYVLARGLNYMLNNGDSKADKLKDAFAVYYNGRRYTMRSVPGDVLEALTETRKFLANRLSPIARSAEEFATGTNYRGQKVGTAQALKDAATTLIPLGLKNVAAMIPGLNEVGDKETSWPQQAMQNIGVKVQRASPIIDAHQIAHDWMQKQPDYKEDTGSYPTSVFRPLQNALEDKNTAAAQRAYRDLLSTTKPEAIAKGMYLSLSKPFTKSKAGDALMLQQLSKPDQATMRAAQSERQRILQAFKAMPKETRPKDLKSAMEEMKLDRIRDFLMRR
jgi:hypothetical protein